MKQEDDHDTPFPFTTLLVSMALGLLIWRAIFSVL